MQYNGYRDYVEEAARRLGRPDLAGNAARQPAFRNLDNQASQAARPDAADRKAILLGALSHRDALHVAALAADRIVDAIAGAHDIEVPRSIAADARAERDALAARVAELEAQLAAPDPTPEPGPAEGEKPAARKKAR